MAPAKKKAPAKKAPAKRPSRRVTPKSVEPLRVSLACGQNKPEGFIGVDIAATDGVDIVHDLESFPWPFDDDSVDEAQIIHYLEHVEDQIGFMNELHRVMKPGAKCFIVSPYYTSVRCWQDPTHRKAISECTFLYYNQGWLRDNRLDHYPIVADFDFEYGYALNPSHLSRSDEAQQYAIRHYWNVVDDIHVTLTAR